MANSSGSSFHCPTDCSPENGSQRIWIASSGQAEMQCSSLPHVSGKASTASASSMTSDFGPQASTHSPQPVHALPNISGIHLTANDVSPQVGKLDVATFTMVWSLVPESR